MESNKRQKEIIDLLKENKLLSVNELSKRLFIGPASIRRDLNKLEKLGHVKRTHGGATLLDGLDSEIPLYVREEEARKEKEYIAKLAVKFVRDKDIILMDSSSTTYQITKFLQSYSGITVITNGAKTAIALGEKNISVYCTGGKLREFSLSYIGDTAKKFLENFCGNTLFFSCRAISDDFVLYDSSEYEAELRKVMIKQCNKVVLLCDSAKIGKKSFYKICDFSNINYLVTDKKPDDKFIAQLKECGCGVIWE